MSDWIKFNRATGEWMPLDVSPGAVVRLDPHEEAISVPVPEPPQPWPAPPSRNSNPNETLSDHIHRLAQGTGWQTKDSGAREVMETGSQRDTREGKGRFELISPFALMRLAGVYERGAKKYDARNWEKGQPFSRFLDSALRHLNRFAMGWTDEDHLSQALWNVAAIIHFQELGRTDLDDMPHYQEGPKA